ncbi:MAG: hypothetical protein R3B90_15560 [Planctomycetaceae bacterium]
MPLKPTDIQVLEATLTVESLPFRTPLKFGGRVMDSTRLLNVEVVVRNEKGQEGVGLGSMPVGNVWAWPTDAVSTADTTAAMEDFAERVVRLMDAFDEIGHPLDILFHVSAEYDHLARTVARDHKLAEHPPLLAQLVAASPLDAALHDAYGQVNGINSFERPVEGVRA